MQGHTDMEDSVLDAGSTRLSETEIMRRIVARVARTMHNVRLWRNQVGRGYAMDGTPISFGLPPGSPDLIGYRSIVITPDMVGQRIAQFVGVEVKTHVGRVSPVQRKFLAMLNEAGAFASVFRSDDDVGKL